MMMTEAIDIPAIDEPTLIVVINRAWRPGLTADQVYEATRGHWRVGRTSREAVSLVIGVADHEVRGVYRPESWFSSPLIGEEGRWGFEGVPANDLQAILGTSVDRLRRANGAANPVRLFLDGIPGVDVLEAAGYTWELDPGDFLGRHERGQVYGGALYGGIEMSSVTPNVFVYSDPRAGLINGYDFDGWNEDRTLFYYTGEGRAGSQTMREGNKAILDHSADGRALRLFVAEGFEPKSKTARQRYLGEFKVDELRPFDVEEALDSNGELRSVFVFRLRPVGDVLARSREDSQDPIAAETSVENYELNGQGLEQLVEQIEVEMLRTPSSMHLMSERLTIVVRREAAMVLALRDFLGTNGQRIVRHRIRPQGQAFSLMTDAYDASGGILYEAKSDATRQSVRMAIGQMLDYQRFMPAGTRLALLVPVLPALDLQDLCRSLGIGICVPNGKKFETYW
ncbi:hypothetical protein [Marisediminicola antarctica]|uniref:hypothetical protein n=1 Tax=Marisediminicola antarctica TaxID=674079 RepID=UPI00137A39C8|nr:hypothetical protein [Marisediminicola antarctica]